MTNEAACVHAGREIGGPRSSDGTLENDSISDLARSLWDTILGVIWSIKKTETQASLPSSSGSPVNPHLTNVCSTAAASPAPKKHESANLLNTSMRMRVGSNGLQTTVLWKERCYLIFEKYRRVSRSTMLAL